MKAITKAKMTEANKNIHIPGLAPSHQRFGLTPTASCGTNLFLKRAMPDKIKIREIIKAKTIGTTMKAA